MGKIKDALYDITLIIDDMYNSNVKPEHIEIDLQNLLTPEYYQLYLDNKDIILEISNNS